MNERDFGFIGQPLPPHAEAMPAATVSEVVDVAMTGLSAQDRDAAGHAEAVAISANLRSADGLLALAKHIGQNGMKYWPVLKGE